MLRTEEGHELHVGRVVQYVDVGHEVVVNARGVGDEANALAFKDLEVGGLQHLYACLHFLGVDQREQAETTY